MSTTVYLVRHGTTDYNVACRWQGVIDAPLNALGEKQGALLTDYFKAIPIDVGATSPLIRARKTLTYVLAGQDHDVPVEVVPGLREIDFGIVEGRRMQEVNVFFPAFAAAAKNAPGRLQSPGGESGAQVYRRVRNAVLSIVRRHLGKTIAIASHGFAIQTWLNYAAGIPAEAMREWVLANVAVSKFTFDEDLNVTVDYVGDAHHLVPALQYSFEWEDLTKMRPLMITGNGGAKDARARAFCRDRKVLSRDAAADPLRREENLALLERAGLRYRRLLNTKGAAYRALSRQTAVAALSPGALAEMMTAAPALLKTPLLVWPDRLLAGFHEAAWRQALDLRAEGQ
ncbi:histidine phosphatase family protein [Pseudoramibacter alactolyticus]|uniref:histidine phosphatase family protein n=1 Tax=Pseudoramibacter alactolyticus TaxID=113287 RepID=UPI0028E6E494|nr:histidine phosphatase family protein [Pseudoramibacter alactolyticus]